MPQVVAERPGASWARAAGLEWWPVDTLLSTYLLGTGLVIFWQRLRIPAAAVLLGLHLAGVAAILALAWLNRARPSSAWRLFRYWYPLLYIGGCYREMAVLIQSLRGVEFDAVMARWDLWLWGVYPTLWLERFYRPWLTEIMQLLYTLFFFALIGVAGWLWREHKVEQFRYYAFAVTLGFLSSFVGYFLVPVRGPRFLLAHLHQAPLQGLWISSALRATLDLLESTHYDCFPSGHVALTLIACWGARSVSPRLARIYLLYAGLMTFSTVYLRYHYTVDLMAGALLAALVLWAAPRLYGEGRGS